ncbi:putative petal formation-expressed [Helianthus annuus]|nr:putative petal formation-expressed [Helianthus annuus]KAJ0843504.1 putative petal formation-expressed [Helianthus annuus]KAJ0959076.1 putative petal formation-expressed [Helianthus annuus]
MSIVNHASSFLCSSSSISSSSSSSHRDLTRASIHFPKIKTNNLSTLIPKIQSNIGLVEEMEFSRIPPKKQNQNNPKMSHDPEVMEKLYVILEAVSDRLEMHKNIGEQRNNWNSLLLTSINTITLTATTMAGIASAITSVPGAPLEALKLSSSFLYLAATGMLIIMNKIQPSQLAEEQRNAARLLKQLESEIKTKIAISNPSLSDVNEAMEKVLAIDRAYPLPLLGVMLEKFPAKVEPAVWWPEKRRTSSKRCHDKNGWSVELEEEMREIIRVLEIKDKDDYIRLGEKALKLNKGLAIAGPLLTGLGAIGSAFLASSPHNSWAMVLGVMGGAMASVVNTIQHGGQVGMVFEMYRSNAGFFKMMEESIESNLKERDFDSRENGEVFEMKVALQLGRSLSELRDVAASSSRLGSDIEEFGSKLF